MMESLEEICELSENHRDCELYTVKDLHKMMDENNPANVYSVDIFRQKLKDRQGAFILYFRFRTISYSLLERYGKFYN